MKGLGILLLIIGVITLVAIAVVQMIFAMIAGNWPQAIFWLLVVVAVIGFATRS